MEAKGLTSEAAPSRSPDMMKQRRCSWTKGKRIIHKNLVKAEKAFSWFCL